MNASIKYYFIAYFGESCQLKFFQNGAIELVLFSIMLPIKITETIEQKGPTRSLADLPRGTFSSSCDVSSAKIWVSPTDPPGLDIVGA